MIWILFAHHCSRPIIKVQRNDVEFPRRNLLARYSVLGEVDRIITYRNIPESKTRYTSRVPVIYKHKNSHRTARGNNPLSFTQNTKYWSSRIRDAGAEPADIRADFSLIKCIMWTLWTSLGIITIRNNERKGRNYIIISCTGYLVRLYFRLRRSYACETLISIDTGTVRSATVRNPRSEKFAICGARVNKH